MRITFSLVRDYFLLTDNYADVLSAALDAGLAVSILVIFFAYVEILLIMHYVAQSVL